MSYLAVSPAKYKMNFLQENKCDQIHRRPTDTSPTIVPTIPNTLNINRWSERTYARIQHPASTWTKNEEKKKRISFVPSHAFIILWFSSFLLCCACGMHLRNILREASKKKLHLDATTSTTIMIRSTPNRSQHSCNISYDMTREATN